MPVTIAPNPKQQFFNAAGQPLSGGKLFTYAPGTATPKATYSDAAGAVSNPNPIILDARGEALIYWDGVYSIALQDALGNSVYTVDNYPNSSTVQQVAKVASIAALRQLRVPQGSDAQTVIVDGGASANDGNGGPFIWSATTSLADDGVNVINPTGNTGNGRWLRLAVSKTMLDATTSATVGGAAILLKGRTAPHANFNWFTSDFTVTGSKGPGQAAVSQDLSDVFLKKYGALRGGTTNYVHPNGSDTDDGHNWQHAYQTLAKAIRNTGNGDIFVWPGVYDLSDFRYTDTYGDHPKRIIAPFGGVIVRVAGDDPTTATWNANGAYGNTYQMALTTTNKPLRVLRKDILDQYGEPQPLPLFADVTTLGANDYGWAYNGSFSVSDTGSTTNGSNQITGVANGASMAVGLSISGAGIPAGATITAINGGTVTISANATATASGVALTMTGRMLYVRGDKGNNISTTGKSNLQVIYGDSSGDNRTLLYSTISYWENITFYGYISVLNVSGQPVPEFWAKKCVFKYGATHAVLVQGGKSYTQDCRAHRQAADGANYNVNLGQVSYGVEINYTTQFAGDTDTYGQSQTLNPQGNGQNKNGSSNHDSYVVRINGLHTGCFGPNIADTSPSYSWCLGTQAGYNALTPNSTPSIPRYGILMQGNNAWLDGCSATGSDAGFNADSSASVNLFNCVGTQSATNGGVFTPYVPA